MSLLSFSRLSSLGVFVLLLGSSFAHAQQADVVDEFRVKTALLYNFSQYIEWPADAFEKADTPFVICVAGNNPFGETILAMQKRSYKFRPILVRFPESINDAHSCQILYVDNAHQMLQGKGVVKALGDMPVLIVSSSQDAMDSGIGIGFVSQAGKIRWTLNLNAAHKSRLKVSAKLIEIALEIVGETR